LVGTARSETEGFQLGDGRFGLKGRTILDTVWSERSRGMDALGSGLDELGGRLGTSWQGAGELNVEVGSPRGTPGEPGPEPGELG